MKRIFCLILITAFFINALQYIVLAQEYDLPELPRDLPPIDDIFTPSSTPSQTALPSQTKTPVKTAPVNQIQQTTKYPAPNHTVNSVNNSYNKNNMKMSYVIPKGKKFTVRLMQPISDRTPERTRVKFISLYPET